MPDSPLDNQEFELTFRSDVVYFWAWFFASIAQMIDYEMPTLRKTTIQMITEEFPTVAAVSKGQADMGFTTPAACATMAYRGIGPFAEKMTNLRAIGSFPHDDRMLWAVPAASPITDISEMKDHPMRLALPGPDFPVRFAVERILEAYGTSLDELQAAGWTLIEDSRCLTIPLHVIRGDADAVIHEGRKTPHWRQLAQSGSMRFLPIRDDVLTMLEDDYGYRRAMLPRGSYPGVETDVPCIDFSDWLMFVRDDMPDELAYTITRIFIEHSRDMMEMPFRMLPIEESDLTYPIDPREVWKNTGDLPLHPAAERYYREHGYM
ncbi:MAG: TAXI family TRAP transporter solute-binding subunit [Alphaproteobacteria bacterium]